MTCLQGLQVLALTPASAYGGHSTSSHRVEALAALGCKVTVLDSSGPIARWQRLHIRARTKLFRMGLPVRHPDPRLDVSRLLEAASRGTWDVIWLEKALRIHAAAMERLRQLQPRALLVGFSPDDMNARHNQSQQFLEALPRYDWFITTKSYNVPELQQRGCSRVLFVGNGYDPQTFRPLEVHDDDRARLGGDVGFIGSYEQERARSLRSLAERGLQVRVWGGGPWDLVEPHPNLRLEQRPLFGDDFARACQSFKINLAFLRKMNRDLQTTRSVEIPACGAFMLAERTREHEAMFREGEEAEFFGSDAELLAKCRRYLADEGARARVARRGRERCIVSGYSNQERVRAALNHILAEHSLGSPGDER